MELFREIPGEQQQKTVGGAIWLPLLLIGAAAVASELASDWDNFKNGLLGRPEEKNHS